MSDSTPTGAAHHLLLIEDDPIARRLIRDIMRELGLRLSITDNGYGAVELCREQCFDLILIDLHMPGMDGYATREGIIDVLQQRDIPPMICLTADTLDETRLHLLRAGFDDLLYKPLDIDLLVERMTRHIVIDSTGRKAAAQEAIPHQLYADLQRMFVDGLAEECRRLRKAREHDDRDSLVHIAHTLAGNAAISGLSPLSRAAMKLERSLRLRQDDESEAALAMLLRLIESLLEAS